MKFLKGLIVTRLMSTDRCYIMPNSNNDPAEGEGRPLMLIDSPMGFEMIEHVAGSDAAAFCQGFSTYMLRELKSGKKRITCVLCIFKCKLR